MALAVLVLIAGALAGPAEKETLATTSTEAAPTTEAPTATPPSTGAPTGEQQAAEPSTTVPPTAVATTDPPTTTATPTTQDPFAGATVSQRNARETAGDYLDYTAFSRTGLIEQLEFEGFTQSDATYAVDALVVDWNDQAAKSAAQYLDYSSFSRSGLVDQLVFEGFTQAEAEYGVGTTGL